WLEVLSLGAQIALHSGLRPGPTVTKAVMTPRQMPINIAWSAGIISPGLGSRSQWGSMKLPDAASRCAMIVVLLNTSVRAATQMVRTIITITASTRRFLLWRKVRPSNHVPTTAVAWSGMGLWESIASSSAAGLLYSVSPYLPNMLLTQSGSASQYASMPCLSRAEPSPGSGGGTGSRLVRARSWVSRASAIIFSRLISLSKQFGSRRFRISINDVLIAALASLKVFHRMRSSRDIDFSARRTFAHALKDSTSVG